MGGTRASLHAVEALGNTHTSTTCSTYIDCTTLITHCKTQLKFEMYQNRDNRAYPAVSRSRPRPWLNPGVGMVLTTAHA